MTFATTSHVLSPSSSNAGSHRRQQPTSCSSPSVSLQSVHPSESSRFRLAMLKVSPVAWWWSSDRSPNAAWGDRCAPMSLDGRIELADKTPDVGLELELDDATFNLLDRAGRYPLPGSRRHGLSTGPIPSIGSRAIPGRRDKSQPKEKHP